jgi:hypothetical protein
MLLPVLAVDERLWQPPSYVEFAETSRCRVGMHTDAAHHQLE